jgi:hypothetical protein
VGGKSRSPDTTIEEGSRAPRGDRIVRRAPNADVARIGDIMTGSDERPGHGTGFSAEVRRFLAIASPRNGYAADPGAALRVRAAAAAPPP